MAFTASAQTPVFHEGFDAAQTKASTELGWYEFINNQEGDERIVPAAEAYQGAGSCKFVNSQAAYPGQAWQRAVKFRNLPLQEGKIYQIKFALMGTNRYNEAGDDFQDSDPRCELKVGLMQGYENSDISILDQNGADQTKTVSYFNPLEFQEYTSTFYFASKANQDAQYKAQGKDEAYINDYFVTFNIYNPGTFYLDEVSLVEINNAVDNLTYGGDVIRVKYMFDTNIAALAKANELGRVILDPSCATVTVAGEATPVEAVELHKDGYLYIFLKNDDPDYYIFEGEADVVVTFTNPNGIINFSGTAGDAKVFAFEAAKAGTYDEELQNVSSFAYVEAAMVSSNPEHNSFCLDESISEFTFTYDHNILTVESEELLANAPEAVLSTGEKLAIKAGQPEISKSITFVRTGTDPLTKGLYTVTVSGITTEKGTPCTVDQVISFETGKIKMAETVYSDPVITLLSGPNGGQPEGWSIMVGGENWNEGTPKEDNGSACRNLNVTGSNGTEYTAFYLCDRDGYTYMKYNEEITLPAGNVEFSVIALSHDEAGHITEFRLEDTDGNEIATASDVCNVIANSQFSSIEASNYVTAKFNNPAEKKAILKVRAPQGGYTACRILGFRVRTYTETPGDKFEPEIVLESKFTGANMPAEGTGWQFYENNNPLEPGSGRNGTSGMLERNFHAKMQTAAFFRECGTNDAAAMRIEYANGNGIEGGVEIPEGNFEITYYAGTWNDENGNANGTSKVYMQIIDAESGNVAFTSEHVNIANFKNGGDCSGQADKVTESFNCKGGKYYLKVWGTNNTVWGALQIIKPGSQAAKWYAAIAEAVEEAEAEATLCEDGKYNGTTKTALLAEIAKAKNPSAMHTVKEFEAAIANLNALKDNMAARRKNVDAFDGNRNSIASALSSCEGTKFEKLEVYPTAVACYESYKDVNSLDLDDATLAAAVADMGNMGALLNNMKGTCVDLLTKQIVELAGMIVALDPESESNDYVLATKDAITDDQALAAMLKKMYAAKLYKKIGAGENPFADYDEELDQTIAKEIAAGAMIQNRDFYCTAIVPDKEQTTIAKVTDYPGWTIEVFAGDIRPVFNTGWGEDGNAPRATKPIADAAVRANWGTNNYDVRQLIQNMPVANYTVSLVVGKDGDQETESYAYIGEGEDQLKSVYLGTDRATSEAQVFENVVPTINGNLGEMLLGGYINISASFGSVDKANLIMVGPAEGFDYAAAAAALEKEIADNVENVAAPVGEPVKVEYYSLDGKKVAKAAGITIKVATYKNGVMQVSKYIAK